MRRWIAIRHKILSLGRQKMQALLMMVFWADACAVSYCLLPLSFSSLSDISSYICMWLSVLQLQSKLGQNFLWHHICHHVLLLLQLQKSHLLMCPREGIQLQDLLKKLLVPPHLQKLNMNCGVHFHHGTHQASDHQQQTLHLVGVLFQVCQTLLGINNWHLVLNTKAKLFHPVLL